MHRLRRSTPHWLSIVLLAVLVTRLGGVHLHLCFDGNEAPATLHAPDTADHAHSHHHMDGQQADKDLDVLGAMLVKKSGGSADLPALLAVCLVLLLLLPHARGQWPAAASHFVFPQFLLLRPPLRGPPL